MTARTKASPAYKTLVAIYQNQTLPLRQRIRAAAAAIAYEKPRLAAVEYTATARANLTSDDLLREIEVVPVTCGDGGAVIVTGQATARSQSAF